MAFESNSVRKFRFLDSPQDSKLRARARDSRLVVSDVKPGSVVEVDHAISVIPEDVLWRFRRPIDPTVQLEHAPRSHVDLFPSSIPHHRSSSCRNIAKILVLSGTAAKSRM